jgi:NDP-mannose synthase
LLPVGEKPLLQLILERLRETEFLDVVLATGYHAELIQTFCGDGSRFGLRITYVHEDEPLGTAGPLSLLRGQLADEDFLLLNGDILTTFDFRRLIEFRRDGGFDVAVGFTRHVYESPFGVLSLDGDRVLGIDEKPSLKQDVSAGIYALRSDVPDHVSAHSFLTIPQLIDTLLASGRSVGAFAVEDVWLGLESVVHFEEAVRRVEGLRQTGAPS